MDSVADTSTTTDNSIISSSSEDTLEELNINPALDTSTTSSNEDNDNDQVVPDLGLELNNDLNHSPSSDSEPAFPFGQLPPEVQCLVWEHLPEPDQLNCRMVCSAWSKLIPLPFGKVTDNPKTLHLLRNSTFRQMHTMLIQDFSQSELPTHSMAQLTIPTCIRRLEFSGNLNTPKSVCMAITHYCKSLQEISFRDFCLTKIESSDIQANWRFPKLKLLEFHMILPKSFEMYDAKHREEEIQSHLNNLIELFKSDFGFPSLRAVNGVFEHKKLTTELTNDFFQAFREFIHRYRSSIVKFDFKENLDVIELQTRGLNKNLQLFDINQVEIAFEDPNPISEYIGCTVTTLEALEGPGLNDLKLSLFAQWLSSIPIIKIGCLNFHFEHSKKQTETLNVDIINGNGNTSSLSLLESLKIIVRFNKKYLSMVHVPR